MKLNKPVNTQKCVITARHWSLTRHKWGVRIHRAYDWAPAGKWAFRPTRVYNSTHEEVVHTGYEEGGFGNYIKTKVCAKPVYLYYAHLEKIFVLKGQVLSPSECIGIMGATGYAYSLFSGNAVHLHHEGREIRDRDKLVPIDLGLFYKEPSLAVLYPDQEGLA